MGPSSDGQCVRGSDSACIGRNVRLIHGQGAEPPPPPPPSSSSSSADGGESRSRCVVELCAACKPRVQLVVSDVKMCQLRRRRRQQQQRQQQQRQRRRQQRRQRGRSQQQRRRRRRRRHVISPDTALALTRRVSSTGSKLIAPTATATTTATLTNWYSGSRR